MTIKEKPLFYYLREKFNTVNEVFKFKVDHPPIILKEIFQLTEDPDYKPIGDHVWKQILLLQV